MARDRGELRGFGLLPECFLAKTIREVNGDNICWGLYGDGFHVPEDEPIEMCRKCGAFERNWNEWYNKQKDHADDIR